MTSLVLIGVSGLDWPEFVSRLNAGELANLADLRRRGIAGWLSTAPPRDGPTPWATLATGRHPEAHGVHRSLEAWSGGLRPVSRAAWRTPPAWARLAAAGVSTSAIGWPASRPGDAWSGLHLDEDFAAATALDAADWALPPHCATPQIREAVRGLRIHPTDITAAMLAPLAPGIASIDQSRDRGLPTLAIAMAKAATLQSAATWMLSEPRPDALFLHQPWLGEVRAGVEARRDGAYAQTLDGAWRFLDGLVGRLAALAGPEALVMVVSPGWGAKPGLLLAAGAGVRPDPEFQGADFLDIAPTLLARFGLEDPTLPGRPITALTPAGDRARAPSPDPEPPAPPDRALLQAAADQGYPPPVQAPPAWHAQGLAELGLMVLQRTPATARDAAQAALRLDPDNPLALAVLAVAHVHLEESEPLPALAEALMRTAPDRGWGALAQGAYHVLRGEAGAAAPWLVKAEADTDPESLLNVAALWLAAGRPHDAERVFDAILARDPENVPAGIGLGMTAGARRDFRTAEVALQRVLRQDPARAPAWLQLAQIYARTGRRPEAERAAAAAARLGASADQAAAAREGRLLA